MDNQQDSSSIAEPDCNKPLIGVGMIGVVKYVHWKTTENCQSFLEGNAVFSLILLVLFCVPRESQIHTYIVHINNPTVNADLRAVAFVGVGVGVKRKSVPSTDGGARQVTHRIGMASSVADSPTPTPTTN